ncbi:MAG: UbiH/UbiF/VisC/COQ6 family ubiquinone biosynthesis hydroxylase [Gammaproteobacteria bacterium]
MTASRSDRFDVVVVGAGLVGSALSALLARRTDFSVALVDVRQTPRFDPQSDYDLRVSAVSRASEQVLRCAGAWAAIESARLCPYRVMRVWDARTPPPVHGEGAGIVFDCAEIGEPNLGYIIENQLMQSALLEVVAAASQVTSLIPAKVAEIDITSDQARVRMEDGKTVVTRLIVAADGNASRVRELAGIDVEQRAYKQRGLVSVVSTELDHQHTAWQRFMPGGPLAFLPLSDGRSSIVWSVPDSECEELSAMDDDAFCRKVGEAADFVLGRITGSGKRASFPLTRQHAVRYTIPRCVLIGDAAHTVHPLAGQGANLGLLDAAALIQCLEDALDTGEDPGDKRVLRRYERRRRAENQLMLSALDGLQGLFGNTDPTLRTLRIAGLSLVDRAIPLKNLFMQRAMGIRGDLPELAKRR